MVRKIFRVKVKVQRHTQKTKGTGFQNINTVCNKDKAIEEGLNDGSVAIMMNLFMSH